ncbi:hypothetical protein, partial [Novosphingobium sp. Chol11]|uniref:tetratricopeptide repeat protein n=1 Tax=Novosphingobium sp. Chol11 TaxID=1385763 RepID=UPI0025DE4272
MEQLEAGDADAAVRGLSAAVKLDSTNGYLHYLLGVAHHTRFERGQASAADLAKAGYVTALRFEPNLLPAQVQLARILAETGNNPEVLYGMAMVDLFLGEMEESRTLIGQLEQVDAKSPLTLRLKSLYLAVSAHPDEAQAALAQYRLHGGDLSDVGYLSNRLQRFARFGAPPQTDGLSGKDAVPSGATGMASGVPAGSGPASAADQTSSAGPERAAKAYSPVAWFNCKGIASSSGDAPSNPANFIKKTDGGDTPGSNPEEKAILLALPA